MNLALVDQAVVMKISGHQLEQLFLVSWSGVPVVQVSCVPL